VNQRQAAKCRCTRFSVCIRPWALRARCVRIKKNPPEECGGQGGVDVSIGQEGPVLFDKWGVKEEPKPRKLRRCCEPRLRARQVPRGQAPARPTNFPSRALRHFRGRDQAMPRFPKKLKFLASRCPCCLSRGVPPRAVARISAVPNMEKQAVCQNLGNTSIQGVAIYRSLWLEQKAPPSLVSARFWQ